MKLSVQLRKRKRLENAFVMVALFLFSGAVISMFENEYAWADPLGKALKLPVFVLTVLFAWLTWRKLKESLRPTLWIWLPVAWAFCSVLWSGFEEVTLQKSITLALMTLLGVWIGTHFGLKRLLLVLAVMMAVIMVLSLLAVPLFWDLAIDHQEHEGAWKGVFVHKNSLGRIMALSFLVFSLLQFQYAKTRFNNKLPYAVGLSMALLVLSDSQTAFLIEVALMVLLGFIWLFWRKPRLFKWAVLLLLVPVAGVGIWILVDGESFFGLLGKDATMTGRTPLWSYAIAMAMREPWLGYGYYGFWHGMEGPSNSVWKVIQWKPPHSHNGFIDLWLDLGLIGVGLFLAGLVKFLIMAVRHVRFNNRWEDAWPLLYGAFMIVSNISESAILTNNFNLFWVLYVATFTMLAAKQADEAQSHDRSPADASVVEDARVEAGRTPAAG
ncbi:O-antigen ligase family protein [Staphylospora marina]|uniref:O-antigen ligase family protein n=1 Tax=Staphylospora marina TaxID=2490858 RepID=UPI000F5B9597|nr:O-antigen ligase [Staphylospora marina]